MKIVRSAQLESEQLRIYRPLGQSVRLRLLLLLVSGLAAAAPVAGTNAEVVQARQARMGEPMHFDIPAQPLEEALIAFANVSGVEVFVEHALAEGQRSQHLHGEYTVEAGLSGLLIGTGLKVRRVAERAYTLVAPVPEPEAGRTPSWSADPERSQFFAALQFAIKGRLCANSKFSPGPYRAAVALWIGSTGDVVDVRLLGAAGNEHARELAEGMRHMSIGQPPPATLEQPVTIVILPRSPDRTGDCASLNSDHG